mmetsp:Transcript_24965/g.63319  ORF Transcript_24965/g.63319 Transcript_24965/m.63319 type:complete len:251 (+) Transcript_24965:1075-1827(+)
MLTSSALRSEASSSRSKTCTSGIAETPNECMYTSPNDLVTVSPICENLSEGGERTSVDSSPRTDLHATPCCRALDSARTLTRARLVGRSKAHTGRCWSSPSKRLGTSYTKRAPCPCMRKNSPSSNGVWSRHKGVATAHPSAPPFTPPDSLLKSAPPLLKTPELVIAAALPLLLFVTGVPAAPALPCVPVCVAPPVPLRELAESAPPTHPALVPLFEMRRPEESPTAAVYSQRPSSRMTREAVVPPSTTSR